MKKKKMLKIDWKLSTYNIEKIVEIHRKFDKKSNEEG